jgi:hypothetical protein
MGPFLLAAALLLSPRSLAADSYESVPEGEADAADQIASVDSGMVEKGQKEIGRAHRDAHAKAHGCVRAWFRVNEHLPPELRQGVFQEGRSYRSWIRFSNGAGRAGKDSEGDARGMAIKLMGVSGPKLSDDEKATQDFLLLSAPAFFVRNAADYVEFVKDDAAGKRSSFFNPFRGRFHELSNARALTGKKVVNPLGIQYWSTTPFLYGAAGPAKFSARPCSPLPAETPDKENPDFLRAAMSSKLKQGEACFDFLVQTRTDPASEPIEDPTVEWSEKKSPFTAVATIEIPPQRFETPPQQDFCENLSMNPWHSVPEHRPLGGINRVRKVVYEAISKLRHELNNAPRAEPTGDESFSN